MTKEDERWMRRAIEVARSKGSDPSTSPLGSVIVLGGTEIAAERNQTHELPDATAHAEMIAIRRACEGVGELELRGATLYSTLQPCGMCTMASIWSKVGRVVYGAGRDDVHDQGERQRSYRRGAGRGRGPAGARLRDRAVPRGARTLRKPASARRGAGAVRKGGRYCQFLSDDIAPSCRS